MASIPDETLRRILVQIQQTAIDSQRALQVTKATQAAKERERRILQLTVDEIKGLNVNVRLYKGVGKMFMRTPRAQMLNELRNEEKEFSDDIINLTKKAKYLEKQFDDAQTQLKDICHNASRS